MRVTTLGLLAVTLFMSMGSAKIHAAESSLTIEQAILEASLKNPRMQRLRSAAEEASWRPLEGMAGGLPHLSISANHLFDLKYQVIDIDLGGNGVSFPAIYPKTTYSLNASWTVFDGGKTPRLHMAGVRTSDAADLEVVYGNLKLEEEIRLKFFQAIAAEQLASVADQNLKTLEDHFAKANVRLRGGSATQFDILRIKVQLEEAVPEKLAAGDNVILARRRVAEAMGLPSDDRPLQGKLMDPEGITLPPNLEPKPDGRADIQSALKRAEAANYARLAALGSYLPAVSLSASKEFYNNNDYSLTSGLKDAYAMGVFLTWNLFDGGASIAKQQEAIHQAAQADAVAREATLKAPVEIEMWKRKFLTNSSLFKARKRAIEAAEESVRLAKLGLDAGVRTSSDVLDSELDLFRARAGLVRAQLDAAEALINLELALGRKLGS